MDCTSTTFPLSCRLNYRLTVACQDTIQDKCADACSSSSIEQPCGGTVLRCLTDKVEEISNEDCRKEVVYFQKMEVQDFRNDVILAETCRNDVDQFCSDVQAGESILQILLSCPCFLKIARLSGPIAPVGIH